jgi:hypothetical protein
MSETPDPLETELSAIRPREISPGLRRRVAQQLSDNRSAQANLKWRLRYSNRMWWLGVAGGVAAACLAAIVFRLSVSRYSKPDLIVIVPKAQESKSVPQATPGPSADTDRTAAWWQTRQVLDGAEPPMFTWPLSESSAVVASNPIPPDLLR